MVHTGAFVRWRRLLSHDRAKFVERFDQPEVWRGFGSEFVVASADVRDESMAFDND